MTTEEFAASYREHIPHQPGVYKYFSNENQLLYIGKAKDLKKRVSSYFYQKDHSGRIKRLIFNIARIEYIIVETEQDALLLENALIKEHQPRYNVMLKDDKSFPFIVIKNEPFPRVFLTRQFVRDGSEYLGPYTSIYNVRIILNLLQRIFPLRTCTLNLAPTKIAENKYKVCLEYHIKNCKAPCVGFQSEAEYMENIAQIRNILKSKFGSVLFFLKNKMNEYAEKMDFEKAQEFKEKINLLTEYQSKSTIVNPKLDRVDVYGYAETEEVVFISYLKISNGTIIQSRAIQIKKILDETKEELIAKAIQEFTLFHEEIVDEIILPFEIDDSFLKRIKITVPIVGDKKKLLDLANKNTLYAKQEYINKHLSQEEKNPTFRILKTMKDDLKLTELPRHIECFDNSNFQGTNAVSSIVVFRDAKPSKKDYRFFNVKTVEGPNDFATMEEAVYRRYRRMIEEGAALPNLIIIDGGKGQLSAAVKSLEKLNIYGKVPIIGIAKKLEEIYFPNDSLPLYINKKSESLKLIQKLRDEAHRFGITAHRNKRSRNFTKSELINIDGIGEKTMTALLQHFKSVKKIAAASFDEIAAITGQSKATILVNHFHNNATDE